MRPRAPLHCVQATAAASTARFRLWTEPPESDYQGALDFRARAAEFEGTRRPSGRVLQTVSLQDATFLREPGEGERGWMRLHSSRWRQGSWDPFGVLDVVAALPPAGDDGDAEIAVWLDSRLRVQRVRYRTSRPRAARLHFELFDLGRPLAVRIPERFESVDLDAVRGALRAGA